MSIKQKDIKLLWGRAANRCAICRVELIQDKNAASSSYTIGEQAHIVGEKDEAARGKSIMPLEERNSYHNLILLCPNHHTEIDNNEEDWPIEKLHQIKSMHELIGDNRSSRLTTIKIPVL
jgi:HNH endonuclease